MIAPDGTSSIVNGDVKCPATPAEEKHMILGILEASAAEVKEGDKFFLVTSRWWKQWSDYVGQEVSSIDTPEIGPIYKSRSDDAFIAPKRPSSIDNTDLIIELKKEEDEFELREILQENHDYVLVTEQVWLAFQKWYGGGPPVARRVINTGSVQDDRLAVEVYPLRIRLTVTPNEMELIVRLSKQDTVAELYQKAREVLNLGTEQIRIWDYCGKIKHSLMNNPKQTLEDADIQMDHEVLLEVQVCGNWPEDSQKYPSENGSVGNELAIVPVEPARSSFSIAGGPNGSMNIRRSSSPDHLYSHSHNNSYDDLDGGFGFSNGGNSRSGPLGLTGLQNLGNTCFMNSALQCLVHTPQFVEFFLQDYSQEINKKNPLGMEGELAIAFGELLRKLWAPGRQPVAPRPFKAKLARFAPQFSGYNQHDSQELLAFLLDGLHEDLNRVKSKPYIESKDTDGRPDEEVALENWTNHKERNDSIIVDSCQGQYKSTLVCPVCSKVSITFDPFMYLSLPLPSTITRTLTVKVFSTDGISPPTAYTVTVPKQARHKDLMQSLSKASNLRSDERLIFTESHNHRHFRILEDHVDWLTPVRDDGLITAHKLPKAKDKAPLLVFLNRCPEEDTILKKQAKNFGSSPLIACVLEEEFQTGSDLLRLFKHLLRPLNKHSDEDLLMLENDGCSNMTISSNDRSQNILKHEMFKFWLMEDRITFKDVLIEWDKPLPGAFTSGQVNTPLQIAVDWSEYALEQYDAKQLEVITESLRGGYSAKKLRQEVVSLYSCLEAFLKEEPLGPEDMWYCPRCKEHRQASKKLDLWRLPDILVVHLKRFSYNRYLKNKLETFVDFPILDLDLNAYIPRKNGAVYNLYAISNHYGSMGGGHYTAYVKLQEDGVWYNFDDSHVSPINENELKTSGAYVLFYQRVRRENGNGSLIDTAES